LPEVVARDPLAAARLRVGVERPDLHPGDALLEQAVGEAAGVVQEPVEILVRTGRARIRVPVGDGKPGGLWHTTDVAVAGARVVRADPVAAGSAEQLVDRLSAHLSEDVPQGDVDCRTPAVLHGGRAETDEGVQALPVPVDLEWILSEEVAGSDLVHPGGHGLGGEEGFAEADDVLVRVDTDVTEIRELVDDDRLDGCDLHFTAS